MRKNRVLAEWQRIAPGEPDTSPEDIKHTRLEKERFAAGIAFTLQCVRRDIGKKRFNRLQRALREFRATYASIITPTLVARRAIELFRNSNAFLQDIDRQRPNEFGFTGTKIQIRLPTDYILRTNPPDASTTPAG